MSLTNTLNSSQSYLFVEQQLAKNLHPVSPREEYIIKLRERLTNPPTILFENPRNGWALVTLFAGLFGGALITWLLLLLFRKKPTS